MKEIIYFQAGKYSNYIGTHFFNTQQSYFTCNEEDESLVDHDRSFREGLASNGTQTYCPRLLLFDFKQNFGSLPKINELYAPETSDTPPTTSSGPIQTITQPSLPVPPYQLSLSQSSSALPPPPDPNSINAWSDFNQVYYHPRSLQPHPTSASLFGSEVEEGEEGLAGWEESGALYDWVEEETQMFDTDFRYFAEESDLLQGLQLTFSSQTHGGFTSKFLSQYNIEYPKTPLLGFINLSSVDFGNMSDSLNAKKALINALSLQSLSSYASLSIPLQPPSTWSAQIDLNNPYLTSSILSAQIESSTLPLRLKKEDVDVHSFAGQLSQGGIFQFASLSSPSGEEGKGAVDYSVLIDDKPRSNSKPHAPFSQHTVFRSLPASVQTEYLSRIILHEPLLRITSTSLPHPSLPSPLHAPLISTLSTPPTLSTLFTAHSHFFSEYLRKKEDMRVFGGAVEGDEVRELVEELRGLGEGYVGEEEEEGEGEEE